jgi:hypothetical protein
MLLTAAIALLTISNPVPTPPALPIPRLRAVCESARMALDDALRRSPTIGRLVRELEQRDVLVFLDSRVDASIPLGQTSLMTVTAEHRFVRVVFNPALPPNRRIEMIGHELQHVLEIAQAAHVRDDAGVRRLFMAIGREVGTHAYETEAARDVERQVRREVSGWRSQSATGADARAKARAPATLR